MLDPRTSDQWKSLIKTMVHPCGTWQGRIEFYDDTDSRPIKHTITVRGDNEPEVIAKLREELIDYINEPRR